MKRAAIVGSVTLGLALLWTAPASAFCLTHGCTDKKQNCEYDENGCLLTGPTLHWASSCVSFGVQRSGSPLRDLGYDTARSAVVEGFLQWLNADCGEGQGPAITISDYGPIECHEPEYNQDSPNANVIMFRDDAWPYTNAIDTLALTTLIFNADTGEIYDADIEVNSHDSAMSIGDIGNGDIDFSSVITHEIGHFLGLSHSRELDATMFPSYRAGDSSLASIEQDDVDGVCAALPPTRETSSNSCDPRHGFSAECALPRTTCALSPGAPGALGSALLSVLGLSSLLWHRRSRPSARRP